MLHTRPHHRKVVTFSFQQRFKKLLIRYTGTGTAYFLLPSLLFPSTPVDVLYAHAPFPRLCRLIYLFDFVFISLCCCL